MQYANKLQNCFSNNMLWMRRLQFL